MKNHASVAQNIRVREKTMPKAGSKTEDLHLTPIRKGKTIKKDTFRTAEGWNNGKNSSANILRRNFFHHQES